MSHIIEGYDAVADVRRIREELYEEYGDDWDAIMAMLKKTRKEYFKELRKMQGK